MAQFQSEYTEALLRAHQPGQYAFHLADAGLAQDSAGAALADEAYAELLQLGYVEQSPSVTVMPHQGGVARKPFKLTAAGIQAKLAEPGAAADGGA